MREQIFSDDSLLGLDLRLKDGQGRRVCTRLFGVGDEGGREGGRGLLEAFLRILRAVSVCVLSPCSFFTYCMYYMWVVSCYLICCLQGHEDS